MPSMKGGNALDKRLNDLPRLNSRSTREDVLNVFTPTNSVTIPAKFSGRHGPLEQLIDALLSRGSDMIVFGERGCGKSSLAYMLHNIAQGKLGLLDYYDLRAHLEHRGLWSFLFGPKRKNFNVIWVDGFARPLEDVIRSVLTRRKEGEFGPGLMSYLEREADQIEVSSSIGFDKIFNAKGELKKINIPEKPKNVKEGFDIAIQRYANNYEEELLVIVDEFETVKEKSEISQYLKSVRHARFVLVGIAATTMDLIGQHASVAREVQAIELPPMNDDELRLIIQIGSHLLDPFCTYSEGAMDEVIAHSNGSPFWCHFLSKALLQLKMEEAGSLEDFLGGTDKRRTVEAADVVNLIDDLPNRPDCRMYETVLQQITMGDETTSKVLLALARRDENIHSSTVLADSLEKDEEIDRNVTLETLEGILQMEAGPLQERGRIRDIVSFSFRDPNLKRYIIMRKAGLANSAD